jgi:type IV pilus assembly protein PilX
MSAQSVQRENGAVLVVGLVILVLMTLLGVTAMQVNGLEEKMAGNYRDQNLAFQAAEATLIEGQNFVLTHPTDAAVYNGANGLLNISDLEPANFFTYNWTDANSQKTSDSFTQALGLTENPRYIIKKLSQNGDKTFFKITARAQGKSPGTQIILQVHYIRTD